MLSIALDSVRKYVASRPESGGSKRQSKKNFVVCYKYMEYPLMVTAFQMFRRFAFRTIKPEEAEEAAEVERICFPPNEACPREHMLERIAVAPDLFLVAIDRETGKLAGFLNGIATDEQCFRDDFFTDAGNHQPDGRNVMLLGLDVLPDYRLQGLGRELVSQYCRKERDRGRKRLVLTCLADKVGMYTKFGFQDLGESASVWGGEKWHEMDITLNDK